MNKLVIVDSGSANLYSIYKACQMVSLQPVISDQPGIVAEAGAVIFPGVGFFNHAARALQEKKLTAALLKVAADRRPLLGICLGMQLLFEESEESGNISNAAKGLNVIPGRVKRFPAGLPVPHVGWNRAVPAIEHPLFEGLNGGAYFYFTHSYYVSPERRGHSLASTEYGFSFTSAVCSGNLYGVQFHPEKSGPAGLRLLANFGKIIADQQ